MVKLTLKKLQSLNPCTSGLEWYKESGLTDLREIVEALIVEGHYDWANFLLPQLMGRRDYLRYVVFAADLALPKFEEKYPDDKRPREAIESVKRVIKSDTKKNSKAAMEAARAAWVVAGEAARAASVAGEAWAAARAAARAASVAGEAARAVWVVAGEARAARAAREAARAASVAGEAWAAARAAARAASVAGEAARAVWVVAETAAEYEKVIRYGLFLLEGK